MTSTRNRLPRTVQLRATPALSLPQIPDLRAILLPVPGLVFQERTGETYTPALLGGPVGRVLCPVSGLYWDTTADDARPLWYCDSNGVCRLRFDGVNDQLRFNWPSEQRIVGDHARLWGSTGSRYSGTGGTFQFGGSTSGSTGWIVSMSSPTVSFSRGGAEQNASSTPAIENGRVIRPIFGHNSGGPSPSWIDGQIDYRSTVAIPGSATTASAAAWVASRGSGIYATVDISAAVIAACPPSREHVAELDRWLSQWVFR